MRQRTEETYHWTALREIVADLAKRHEFVLDVERRTFVADGVEVVPPRVVPWPFAQASPRYEETARERAARLRSERSLDHADRPLERFLDTLPESLPRQCVVLLQAGAASIGYFEAGEPIATKSMKRYVVRGRGRAQATFLASKGKSRYGSRLRLQNARKLHDDVNRRLTALWDEFGPPAQLFISAPPRMWAEQFEGQVRPPFAKEWPVERIGMDLPVPTTDVLLRAYRTLCYGVIARRTKP